MARPQAGFRARVLLNGLALLCLAVVPCRGGDNNEPALPPAGTSTGPLAAGRVLIQAQPPWATPAAFQRSAAASEPMRLHIYLRLRNRDAALAEAATLNDPDSPAYAEYLTTEQFRATYAPTAEDAAALRSWLEDRGFTYDRGADNHFFIAVHGTVAQVESAFQTRIGWYQVRDRLLRAPVSAASVPAELADLVTAVVGLHDASSTMQPSALRRGAIEPGRAAGAAMSMVERGTWSPEYPGIYLGGLTGAGGGGTSALYPRPSYQEGIVPDALAQVGDTLQRVVPDVSLLANPDTGFLVGMTQTFPDGVYYEESPVGGTSLATPLLAALVALAEQQRGSPVGFINPSLYKHRHKLVRDITPQATAPIVFPIYLNGADATGGILYLGRTLDTELQTLHTTKGYDNTTGLGVPRVRSFIRHFGTTSFKRRRVRHASSE